MIIILTLLQIILIFSIVKAQDQSVDVELGTTVNLQCKPSSSRPDVPTTYQWFNPQNNVLTERNQNLVLERFSYEHQGVYTCKASQIIDGKTASNSRSLYVRVKSQAESFQLNVLPKYDSFVTGIIFIQCKVNAPDSNMFNIEWITPSGQRKTTSMFFLNKATINDGGRYTCRVTRKSDNVVVEAFTDVMIAPLPIVIDSSGSMSMGSTLILNCGIDLAKIKDKVYTKFQYEWLDPLNRQISTSPEVRIPIVDRSNLGFYTCRIISEGAGAPHRQEQRIEVKFSGRTGNIPDETTTYTGSMISNPSVIRFFQPLELRCHVQPIPMDVSYRIMFNGQQISSNPIYTIPRLDKEHMGIYECIINGRDRNSQQSVSLTSKLTIQPEYRSDMKIELAAAPGPQITVRVGDKRELHCEIPLDSGLNGRDAVWYFDGRELSKDQLARYNVHIIPRLYVSIAVLKNIQTNNQGKYECRIRGQTKEAYIIVMSRTKNIEVNPPEDSRKVGDGVPVEFHCRIDGYSTKNRDLIWTFISSRSGQIVPLDARWKRSDEVSADETSFIVLQQAEDADDGTYICTEPSSRDTARAKLNVKNDLRIVVTPPIIRLRVGGTAVVHCSIINVGRSAQYPEFSLGGGRSAGSSNRMSTQNLENGKTQLQFSSVTAKDNGTEFICRHGGLMAKSVLSVDQVCTAGFRLCRNGECINSAKFCDRRQDCSDGSDEDERYCKSCDPLSKRCENFNGQQPSSTYYQIHWGCDGEDDCGNGYDESRCFGNVLTCGGLNYRCNDGLKTIPKAFLCDKDRDCPNGDDEDRCITPTIINESEPSYQTSVKRGETLTLTCQAAGYPLPKIVWRYNWGCLTDDNRMIVTDSYRDCGSTISILSITNFQPGDDGIYNCEALSAGKRSWSRDYQVLMDFKN